MQITYRKAMFIVVGFWFVTLFLPGQGKPVRSGGFNPCQMWDRPPFSVELASVVWVATFALLVGASVFNRRVFFMVSALNLVATLVTGSMFLWDNLACWSLLGVAVFLLDTVLVVWFDIRHLLAPRLLGRPT